MNIQQHIISRVEHYTKIINQVFPTLNFAVPTVEFYFKRKAAGLAYRKGHKIAFNTIIAQENIEKFDETIIHELSHLITYILAPGAKAHGPEFMAINEKLGGRLSRCNSYSLENVPHRTRKVERQFEYTCGCQGKVFKLTAVRHNRILRGLSYKCNACHKPLVPLHTKQVGVSQFKLAA